MSALRFDILIWKKKKIQTFRLSGRSDVTFLQVGSDVREREPINIIYFNQTLYVKKEQIWNAMNEVDAFFL